MKDGINQVIIMGRVSDDPSFTLTKNNNDAIYFHLLTHTHYKDKFGDSQVADIYHKICVYDENANLLSGNIKHDDLVMVIGHIRYRRVHDKHDYKKLIIEIIADKVDIVLKSDEYGDKIDADFDEVY